MKKYKCSECGIKVDEIGRELENTTDPFRHNPVRIKECKHDHIYWDIHQYNPDFGHCAECGKKVIAEDTGSAIYDEDDKEFYEIIKTSEFL